MKNTDFNRLTLHIRRLLSQKERVVVAIDGRCGSGKTTAALQLGRELQGAVFPMDDFFLRPEQRTPERLSKAGENVDHERFLQEVLLPVHRGEPVSYRPYVCARQTLGEPITVPPHRLTLVEGAYACHPSLWQYYDLRIFLTVDPQTQLRRIESRNGAEGARQFRDRWIPYEEAYFSAFAVPNRCDIIIDGA